MKIINEYVQYGCGLSSHRNWRNFDASPTLRLERLPFFGKLINKNKVRFPENVEYGDIVKGLPISKNSCKAVYCSHVLEHLSYIDCKLALVNTYSVLQKGGIFRLVVPDFEFYINEYNESSSAEAALVFLRGTMLGKEKKLKGIKNLLIDYFGNNQHLWMWDYNSMQKELFSVGFSEIRRAKFNDSSCLAFKEVEIKDRWDSFLGIECIK